jgi:glutamate--cysteine ligase
MLELVFLRDDVGRRLFGNGQETSAISLGLEVEFIPQQADHTLLSVFGSGGTLEFLRSVAERHNWRERRNQYGVPFLVTASGGVISFEPGGQIEYSTPTFSNCDAVLRDVRVVANTLMKESCAAGITLVSAGLDPFNGPENAPLQLSTPRYANMARHFAAISPAGARMMRQTTAVQVNIGLGPQPLKRWRLLNAMVPALTALFANSARYAGRDSGYASYRSQTWRDTDPARIGVLPGLQPVDEYLDFALGAAAILPPLTDEGFLPFGQHLREATAEDWRAHLTTLFPDVRPKGYFEIRCIDGQPSEHYGAVLALIAGVVLDTRASGDAEVLLPPPTNERVARAGRLGLADYELRSVCEDLVEVGIAGCRRLPQLVAGEVVAHAEELLRMKLARATPTPSGAGYDARERLPR